MNNKIFKKTFILALVFLTSFFLFASAQAQGTDPNTPTDDEVNAIAKNLYCPVCPNTPLDVCETKACQDWREQIRMQLAQGWTEEQIMDYFVVQYGERVLAEPQRGGFTSLVWVLPVVITGLGLLLVWWVLTQWRKRAASEPAPARLSIEPGLREKIEKELQALD